MVEPQYRFTHNAGPETNVETHLLVLVTPSVWRFLTIEMFTVYCMSTDKSLVPKNPALYEGGRGVSWSLYVNVAGMIIEKGM